MRETCHELLHLGLNSKRLNGNDNYVISVVYLEHFQRAKNQKEIAFYQANTWNRSEMANFFLPIVFVSAPC